jgi:hypothetical protein
MNVCYRSVMTYVFDESERQQYVVSSIDGRNTYSKTDIWHYATAYI